MDVFVQYQIFFTLRDEYPEYKDLIAELMSYAFTHKDSFSSVTYLNGNFNEKDIVFVFEKMDMPVVQKVVHSNLRSKHQTIVELNLAWHCDEDCQCFGEPGGCLGEKYIDNKSPIECPYFFPDFT